MDGKEKNKNNQVVILSPGMAAFLVLNGCRIESTKKNLKKTGKYAYFFKKTDRLSWLMSKFNKHRDTLRNIEGEVYKEYIDSKQ